MIGTRLFALEIFIPRFEMAKTKIRDGFRGHDPKSNYGDRWEEIFGKKTKEPEEKDSKLDESQEPSEDE